MVVVSSKYSAFQYKYKYKSYFGNDYNFSIKNKTKKTTLYFNTRSNCILSFAVQHFSSSKLYALLSLGVAESTLYALIIVFKTMI